MDLKTENFEQLGYSPYHYVQSGDYVYVGDDHTDGFRKFQGPVGPVSDFSYPIFRLKTDDLLTHIDELTEKLSLPNDCDIGEVAEIVTLFNAGEITLTALVAKAYNAGVRSK